MAGWAGRRPSLQRQISAHADLKLSTNAVNSPLALNVKWRVWWITRLFPGPSPIILKLLTKVSENCPLTNEPPTSDEGQGHQCRGGGHHKKSTVRHTIILARH